MKVWTPPEKGRSRYAARSIGGVLVAVPFCAVCAMRAEERKSVLICLCEAMKMKIGCCVNWNGACREKPWWNPGKRVLRCTLCLAWRRWPCAPCCAF